MNIREQQQRIAREQLAYLIRRRDQLEQAIEELRSLTEPQQRSLFLVARQMQQSRSWPAAA